MLILSPQTNDVSILTLIYAPLAFKSMDQSDEVAPMNNRCPSDMPKEQFAATSGVKILPIKSPVGIKDLDTIARRDVQVSVRVAPKTIGYAGFDVGEHHRIYERYATGRHVEAHHAVVAKLTVRPSSLTDVENGFVWRERDTVRLVEIFRNRGDRQTIAFHSEYAIAVLFRLVAVTEFGMQETVIRVGEPDRTVGFNHDIVRRCEFPAHVAIRDWYQRSVVLQPHHRASSGQT